MGRFWGENLENHDSSCRPPAIKIDPLSLYNGKNRENQICNRVLSAHCNFHVLVESLSLYRDFFPTANFSYKFSGACVILFSLKSHYKLNVDEFPRRIYLYILVLSLRYRRGSIKRRPSKRRRLTSRFSSRTVRSGWKSKNLRTVPEM